MSSRTDSSQRTAPKQRAAAELDELAEELPVDLGADFVPPAELGSHGGDGRPAGDSCHGDSVRVQESFDRAVRAASAGREQEAVRHYLEASKLAEDAREWYLAAVSCHRVGDFLRDPPPPLDLERAIRMYQRAVAAYERCGLFAEARELSYRVMCLRMRRANALKIKRIHRLELFFFWATAGFGYRPLRVIGTAVVAMLLFGVVYWLTGGAVASDAHGPVGLIDAIYFSGITFATVGYGDFTPAPHARILALTEGAVGVFTIGFFVAVLANRLSKS